LIERRRPYRRMQSRRASPSPAAAGCRGAAGGAHYRPGPPGNNLNSGAICHPLIIGRDMFILRRLTICEASAQYP
jgi:hypothetical protein